MLCLSGCFVASGETEIGIGQLLEMNAFSEKMMPELCGQEARQRTQLAQQQ
jgi:hypothetical protein